MEEWWFLNKWYADKDDLIKGMAEKQDQMEQQMDFAQFNMLGNTQGQQVESNLAITIL